MNLIMLDIDEVLCTHRARAGVICPTTRCGPDWMDSLDGTGVGMVVNLALDHNAKIVIISTWRKRMTKEDLIRKFSVYYGSFGTLLADDWATDCGGPRRSHEVGRYFKRNGHLYHNTVIIDDDTCEGYEHIQVKPNQLDGFSLNDYLSAKSILST